MRNGFKQMTTMVPPEKHLFPQTIRRHIQKEKVQNPPDPASALFQMGG
jgi:hypothetical protein